MSASLFLGNVYASRFYEGSDAKLKQDVQDLGSAMEIIRQLRPKHYHFKQEGNYKLMRLPEGLQYGLIAQDVEKVLPGIVKESEFDPTLVSTVAPDSGRMQPLNASAKTETIHFKALDYTALIPILIKGIQEQDEENKALKEKINELDRIVQDLKKRQFE